jgi:hypothetical protein
MKGATRQLIAATVIGGVVGGVAGLLAVRKRFERTLDALDRQLADAQTGTAPRTDLPDAVMALAIRLGANRLAPASFVDLRQRGTMWFKPDGRPQHFTAAQRIGTSLSGFVWRARIGRLGAISVVDSLVAGRGLLEARLFGALQVSKISDDTSINEGETLRYLAELPLNPDAILLNHALEWTAVDARMLVVASGKGESRAEIRFGLDADGMIATASATSRAFDATGKRYPWHGRFWDYQGIDGRLIPMQAEVAWDIDGTSFTYWRGTITHWLAICQPSAPA